MWRGTSRAAAPWGSTLDSCITCRAEFPWDQARRPQFPSHGKNTQNMWFDCLSHWNQTLKRLPGSWLVNPQYLTEQQKHILYIVSCWFTDCVFMTHCWYRVLETSHLSDFFKTWGIVGALWVLVKGYSPSTVLKWVE